MLAGPLGRVAGVLDRVPGTWVEINAARHPLRMGLPDMGHHGFCIGPGAEFRSGDQEPASLTAGETLEPCLDPSWLAREDDNGVDGL